VEGQLDHHADGEERLSRYSLDHASCVSTIGMASAQARVHCADISELVDVRFVEAVAVLVEACADDYPIAFHVQEACPLGRLQLLDIAP